VPPSLNQLVEDLQTAYLHALLLQAYVRHAVASGTQPAVVNVQFSYPTCFDRDDLEKLERSMDRAASRLAGSTNVKWTCRSGVDESTAAVAATEPGGAEDSIGPGVDVKVILDMGGGSTDIVVQFPGAQEPIVYLTSVAYAGAALLDAFAGRREADGKRTSSCLGAGATVDTLQRRVRGATSFRDILSDPDLFHKSWLKVAANRTRHFYGYLIEYVARLLAAGILDGRFALKRDNHLKPQLAIGFFFFGQGWGFSSQLTEADPFKHVADEVMKRTKQLVGAERSEYALALRKGITGLSAVIGEVDRRRVPHAKAAVAVGLLKAPATDGRSAASQDRGRRGRSITGWAVKTGSEPDVPWFAYHTTEGDDPFGYAFRGRCTPWSGDGSADAQPLGDLFDQPADDQSVPMALRKATPWYRGLREAWIEWPCPQPELPRDLKGIEDLDPKTKGKRLQVLPGPCEGNEGKGNRGWFAKGPYEWLLERFFKPKLAEITN
jgi:hypothetical protein